ncbi:DNA glycosylase [Stachybotrys elegans]|uniref:Adenine DNA glycosylase n=1 Tax=Stachybotrys elegans TaxID=80388 RepID=A0A8K0WKA7_9HYPO|nr:DNA glycosylase [Stachybotrys elegans]
MTKARAGQSTRKSAANDDDDGSASANSDDYVPEDTEAAAEEPLRKKQKTAASRQTSQAKLQHLLTHKATPSLTPAHPPLRQHSFSYHRPLLLDLPANQGRALLLGWFDSVSTTRRMPWRKPWVDPLSIADPATLRQTLERRAYEVWISEIMLQQTRVATVIDYWNKWMAKWPTIQLLAAASPDDVLAAWRGLGYYSRATRIHEAAKLVVADPGMNGLLPSDVSLLEKKVPGVGRYTAGAISAIVFGQAAPMVDGNVLRVLSRQTGLLGNIKTDKAVIDFIWAAAEALVKAVAKDGTELEEDDGDDGNVPVSSRPGRWGQALMELGSTVCTPKPNCGECPITSTCRVYAEGLSLATTSKKQQPLRDMEDGCELCHSLEEAGDGEDAGNAGSSSASAPSKPKQATLAMFSFAPKAAAADKKSSAASKPDQKKLEAISAHARKFPLKVVKKAVREEETVVCAIRHGDRFLISRRPSKGLLAGMWELPSQVLPEDGSSNKQVRKQTALDCVSQLAPAASAKSPLRFVAELGAIPWLFSHLKLTMHVQLFAVSGGVEDLELADNQRWATEQEIDDESMGTGMRKCWALAKEAKRD